MANWLVSSGGAILEATGSASLKVGLCSFGISDGSIVLKTYYYNVL